MDADTTHLETPQEESLNPPQVRKKSVAREYAEAIIFAILLVLTIRVFGMQAFKIPTGSMENTLLVGDFLFVNKFVYGAHVPFTDLRLPALQSPKRGDVVVFKYPKDETRDFIKRVVGEPGDVLEIRDSALYINDVLIDEPYAKFTATRRRPPNYNNSQIFPEGKGNRDFYGPVTIPEGQYFVMGDNRDQSDDSRFWGFLEDDLIIGKAMIIYLSLGDKRKPRLARIGDIIR